MFGSYCLQKFLNLCVSRTRKLSQFLFFTVITSSQGFVSGLSSIVSLQDPLKCLKSSLQGAQWQVSLLFEKRKMSQNDHQLSLVVIHCHSLSPDVPLVVTRCTPRCHLLLLIAIRCSSLYHSMSLDVSLVCLFINNRLGIVATHTSIFFWTVQLLAGRLNKSTQWIKKVVTEQRQLQNPLFWVSSGILFVLQIHKFFM